MRNGTDGSIPILLLPLSVLKKTLINQFETIFAKIFVVVIKVAGENREYELIPVKTCLSC